MSNQSNTAQTQGRPRFGRIPAAVSYSGLGRTKLYELAPAHPGLFRKNGSAVLIDFDILDRILDALPNAEIKARNTNNETASVT